MTESLLNPSTALHTSTINIGNGCGPFALSLLFTAHVPSSLANLIDKTFIITVEDVRLGCFSIEAPHPEPTRKHLSHLHVFDENVSFFGEK